MPTEVWITILISVITAFVVAVREFLARFANAVKLLAVIETKSQVLLNSLQELKQTDRQVHEQLETLYERLFCIEAFLDNTTTFTKRRVHDWNPPKSNPDTE